mmetsp:Transcript_9341/g.26259  ORF Transcript_9341/g.26259 Transcript_9341/m.26259 type:complete len:211 (-) Transcript_9341:1312-1944(-)
MAIGNSRVHVPIKVRYLHLGSLHQIRVGLKSLQPIAIPPHEVLAVYIELFGNILGSFVVGAVIPLRGIAGPTKVGVVPKGVAAGIDLGLVRWHEYLCPLQDLAGGRHAGEGEVVEKDHVPNIYAETLGDVSNLFTILGRGVRLHRRGGNLGCWDVTLCCCCRRHRRYRRSVGSARITTVGRDRLAARLGIQGIGDIGSGSSLVATTRTKR